MVYSLDKQIEDYIQHTEGIEDKRDEISMEHYRKRGLDKDVDNELINAGERILNADTSDTEVPDTTLIAQVESIEDLLIYQLTNLVLRSNKVRIETMNEIEQAELEDPVLPNKWIFHKDAHRREVIDNILRQYEMLKNEDEREEDDGT
jgi:ferritin-like metal-binding protein YciE